jgi:uncharacterized protein YukE
MAAGGEFRVDPEALAGSAEHVSGQGEDLASAHLSSDNRIEAAQSGWVGTSAAALNARMAAWLETSRRLVARVGGHALDLQNETSSSRRRSVTTPMGCGRSASAPKTPTAWPVRGGNDR